MDESMARAIPRSRRLALEVLEDRLMLSAGNSLPVSPAALLAASSVISGASAADSHPDVARPAPPAMSAHPPPKNLAMSPEDAAEYGDISPAAQGKLSLASFLARDRNSPAPTAEYSFGSEEQEAAERAAQGRSAATELRETIAGASLSAGQTASDASRPVLTPSGPGVATRSPTDEPVLGLVRSVPTVDPALVGSRVLTAVGPSRDLGGPSTLGLDIRATTFPVPTRSAAAPYQQPNILAQASPESEPWHLLPEALAPLAGALPIDLGSLRRNVDAFFARLANVGEEDSALHGSLAVIPWLMVATAVAFEFARLRGRSPVNRLAPGDAVAAELQVFTAQDEP
jgi:hypothetical protein